MKNVSGPEGLHDRCQLCTGELRDLYYSLFGYAAASGRAYTAGADETVDIRACRKEPRRQRATNKTASAS